MIKYDVIVIGGGHAGCEAAHAAARMGAKTLLITMKNSSIGQLSCNPAIGGIGKSHLAREVDAMDGLISKIADNSALQRRKLNLSKGPAVHATRIQTCRHAYKKNMQLEIEKQKNLSVHEGIVCSLITKKGFLSGVKLRDGTDILSKSIVLTAGTFLGGVIHCGENSEESGRLGDDSSKELESFFRSMNFEIGRLKTGTPPRLLRSSINFSKLLRQDSDKNNPCLSYLYDHYNREPKQINQIPCYITSTNSLTHEIISSNKHLSAIYSGSIKSKGPRYCPSIEDKIVRFSDKNQHQIFLEPETSDNESIYPNGISTSLPEDIQIKFLRTIEGLERCEIIQPGYAVEYSYFNPTSLHSSLATKTNNNLFFAGQINGTTGYEEAAAQGIIAGYNAAALALGRDQLILDRENSYIGVMIDDLVTKGVTEPYRMFTSRAEYRLKLREDNADMRLTEKMYKLGLVTSERFELFEKKRDMISREELLLDSEIVKVNSSTSKQIKSKYNIEIKNNTSIKSLLKIPTISYQAVANYSEFLHEPNITIGNIIATQERYKGYLVKQDEEILQMKKTSDVVIPKNIVFDKIDGLSNEAVEKLNSIRPKNLGQASRIPGITPSVISLLRIFLKKYAA